MECQQTCQHHWLLNGWQMRRKVRRKRKGDRVCPRSVNMSHVSPHPTTRTRRFRRRTGVSVIRQCMLTMRVIRGRQLPEGSLVGGMHVHPHIGNLVRCQLHRTSAKRMLTLSSSTRCWVVVWTCTASYMLPSILYHKRHLSDDSTSFIRGFDGTCGAKPSLRFRLAQLVVLVGISAGSPKTSSRMLSDKRIALKNAVTGISCQ